MEVITVTEEIANYYPITDIIKINNIPVKKLLNFNEIYEHVKRLGSGSFGIVNAYKERATGNIYALKEIVIDDSIIQSIQDEIKILQVLSQDNISIVKYYDSFVYEQQEIPIYVIVTEYIKGYTLQNYLDNAIDLNHTIPSKFVFNLTLWLFTTLSYIHDVGYVHRDIKPDNIMIDTETKRFVLIDFGLTCAINNKSKSICDYKEFAGSPAFLAPERWDKSIDERSLFKSIVNDISIMRKADLWAAGLTIYTIWEKKVPWTAIHITDMRDQILSPSYAIIYSPPRDVLGYNLQEILRMILNKNPNQRPPINQLIRKLLDIVNGINITPLPIVSSIYSPIKLPPIISSYNGHSV